MCLIKHVLTPSDAHLLKKKKTNKNNIFLKFQSGITVFNHQMAHSYTSLVSHP